MSKMIDGQWVLEGDIATVSTSGEYKREDSVLRDWIGDEKYPAEANRYHLYVAYNCPWAHRTLIFRALKKLESVIGVSVVKPRRTDQGWVFGEHENTDHLFAYDYLHQVYQRAENDYTGRVTVPVLFDTQTGTIVSNESSEIIRMLNSAFNSFTDVEHDFFPPEHQEAIESWNEKIYH
ncbi:MAG: glutathione S-transferase family protein, partial [Gammaproteobacteria bacterium]